MLHWLVTTVSLVALAAAPKLGVTAEAVIREQTPYAAQTVVAEIDGSPLTLGEVLFRFASLPESSRVAYESHADGLKAFVEDLAANLLVVTEAEQTGLQLGELYDQLMEIKREEVLRDLYSRRTLLAGIDDVKLRARYALDRSRFLVDPEVEISHILVTPRQDPICSNSTGDDAADPAAARAKILRLRDEIKAGADFTAVARRSSEDVLAAEGGKVKRMAAGNLVPEVRDAALVLPIGEISPVIESSQGYHLIIVHWRRAPGQVSFEAARELLYQEMAGELRPTLDSQVRDTRQELLMRHHVELFTDRLPW